MGNRERGEVTLKADGAEHVLRFGINEICNLEEALDAPIMQIVEDLQEITRFRLSTCRTVMRIGLSSAQRVLSDEEAGDIMTKAGIAKAVEAIGEAVMLAFPEVAAGAAENPTKGSATKAGNGSPS